MKNKKEIKEVKDTDGVNVGVIVKWDKKRSNITLSETDIEEIMNLFYGFQEEEVTHEECDVCGNTIVIQSPDNYNDVDYFIPFGGYLEPLPARFVCPDCIPQFKSEWDKRFAEGHRHGDWQKSNAEQEMARKHNLRWVNNSGLGTLGSEHWSKGNEYVTEEVYNKLKNLPYYGYCGVCGSVQKGGFCVREECEKSFHRRLTHKPKQ